MLHAVDRTTTSKMNRLAAVFVVLVAVLAVGVEAFGRRFGGAVRRCTTTSNTALAMSRHGMKKWIELGNRKDSNVIDQSKWEASQKAWEESGMKAKALKTQQDKAAATAAAAKAKEEAIVAAAKAAEESTRQAEIKAKADAEAAEAAAKEAAEAPAAADAPADAPVA